MLDRIKEPARSDQEVDDCAAVSAVLRQFSLSVHLDTLRISDAAGGMDLIRVQRALGWLWRHGAVRRLSDGSWEGLRPDGARKWDGGRAL